MINPIDQTQEFLRTNLLSSLINTYNHNFENNSQSNKYYEINNVYDDTKHKLYKNIPNQEYSLGLLLPETETNHDSRGEFIKNDIHTLTNIVNLLFPKIHYENLPNVKLPNCETPKIYSQFCKPPKCKTPKL